MDLGDIRTMPGLGRVVNRIFPEFQPNEAESAFLSFDNYDYGRVLSNVVNKLGGQVSETERFGEENDFMRQAVGLGLLEYMDHYFMVTEQGRKIAKHYDGMKFYRLTPRGQEIAEMLVGRGSK